jgi:hypothetical protein
MSLKHSPSKQVRRLRRAAASVYLKEIWGLEYSPRTLAKLACIGGPPMEYAGRFPLYTDGNLDTWGKRENFTSGCEYVSTTRTASRCLKKTAGPKAPAAQITYSSNLYYT